MRMAERDYCKDAMKKILAYLNFGIAEPYKRRKKIIQNRTLIEYSMFINGWTTKDALHFRVQNR